ncbi:type 3 dihydrofolate reductase [Aliikangiella sp. IMCC44359]|uniref:type 3 dihydrofolate reductase n=1 Tax=Aliikangiella sp. IMCC44359 TaxID=3459125 RepID=UPI00403ABF10
MTKPIISLIAAMAKDRVIGKDNQMPWHLPADLRHFKTITMDKPIIMGRKTFESIGRPLPGRKNIVISRQISYQAEGCDTANSIEAAIELVNNVKEIMIIGGGFLYSQALPIANKLYLTFIDLTVDGDTQFPEYEQLALTEIKREAFQADDKNPYSYEFVDYLIN